jgi:nucleoside-diphosphate-sugar epimerase
MGGLERKEVLITGGTGFIGLHLTKRLIEEKAIVNIITTKKNTDTSFSKELYDNVKIWNADLLDFDSLRKCIKQINPKKIFHLAAFVNSDSTIQVSQQCIQTNIQGTMNLLYSLRKVNSDRFVYVGTSEVYGAGNLPFSEKQPIFPSSPYSITKASGEFFCFFAQKAFNIPVVVLRLSVVYGPNQNPRKLIPYVILCAINGINPVLTKGDQTRDFIYVSDIVEGIIQSSIKDKAIGEIINLGSGEQYSIQSVVTRVINLMNNSVIPLFEALPSRKYELKNSYCSISKARKVLNWVPRVPLDEGLEETINWYSQNYREGSL